MCIFLIVRIIKTLSTYISFSDKSAYSTQAHAKNTQADVKILSYTQTLHAGVL